MPTLTSSGPWNSVPGAGTQHTDALLWGTKWGSGGPGEAATVTYSFPDQNSSWDPLYGGGEPNAGQALSGVQRAAFEDALQSWANVANIRFVETADARGTVGDIRAAATEIESNAAHTYLPGPSPEAGDVWLNASAPSNETPSPGNFGFFTLVHEIGHAIGLKHSFEYSPTLPGGEESRQFTVMSYDTHPEATIEPAGPMLYDIAAIQYIYGPNMSFHAGDDTYRFSATREQLQTLWDAGGSDTIDAANQTLGVSIDLEAGRFSSIGVRNDGQPAMDNLAIAYGVVIENAIGGAGADRITGNAAANRLSGNGGDDLLYGHAGDDIFTGGAGADIFDGSSGTDAADYSESPTAVDIDLASRTAQGGDAQGDWFDSIENLIGSAFDDTLAGDCAPNRLDGLAGDDQLHGYGGDDLFVGGAGADILTGGTGIDTASYQNSDSAVEVDLARRTGQGGDARGDLFGSIENLIGSAFDDTLAGDHTANVMYGLGGNDSLYGYEGDDTLIAGPGADILTGGIGIDTAKDSNSDAAVDIDLAERTGRDGDAQGNLFGSIATLIGSRSAYDLAGDNAAKVLYGLAGNGRFHGYENDDLFIGGPGADILPGGAGIDMADYARWRSRMSLDLDGSRLAGDAAEYRLGSIENVLGSPFDDWLNGDNAGNLLQGGSGQDRLIGDTGDDWCSGGSGTDSFVFDILNFGSDTIDDFLPGAESAETLDFRGLGLGVSDFSFTDVNGGADCRIAISGSSGNITLLGVQSAQITSDDILLA